MTSTCLCSAVTTYAEFLASKAQLANDGGFEPAALPSHLFDFQRFLVEWAVRQGRGAIFADCGLGKTPMGLAWASEVYRHVGGPVLFLTPLAVGFQVEREAEKFGHDASLSRDGTARSAITITNYEQLAKFDPSRFGGVVCDESSILKSFDGATRAAVTEFMRLVPFRLLATATAAPNDYTELGTSSEAIGGLGYVDTLTRFFINKDRSVSSRGRSAAGRFGGNGGAVEWRLKGPAEVPFWRWVASWARAMRRPSDYGFEDRGFVLPALSERVHVVESSSAPDGTLFASPAVGLREEREESKRTLIERCERAADCLRAGSGVAWCHLNSESSLLTKLIDGAVEVAGSDSDQAKEEKLRAFTERHVRVLVTKPKIGAWGLNWQHAHRMTYFPSHSYEQYYQAIRRMWRFGQEHEVIVDVVTTKGGQRALTNLQRKAAQADAMFVALVDQMRHSAGIIGPAYDKPLEVPTWLAA